MRDGQNHGSWHGHGPGAAYHTMPPCFAEDEAFLTSMALCIHNGCGPELASWEREKYWDTTIADPSGAGKATISPKWMYGKALDVALEQVEELGGMENVPIMTMGVVLNTTSLVEPTWYAQTVNTYENYSWAEIFHSRYGLVLLLASAAFPIAMTWGHCLPFFTRMADIMAPYLDMSIYKNYYARTLPYWLGNAPTIGQTFAIVAFVTLNIVATAVDMKTIQPHNMFPSPYINLLVNLGNRTGVLCFALSPLLLVLAARNNLLLYVTDWPHGTYMMMHRWVARMWFVQAVMHSIIELMLYKHLKSYDTESVKPAWIWGAAATFASFILVATAVTWMRRNHYETFLIFHIVLAVVTLVGSYYHVYLYYDNQRGYEYWLYACFAIWGGDRAWRIWRTVKIGAHRSTVRELGGGIVRVDIPGVRWHHVPGAHGYVFFPSLSWRVWENHPFSVTPTALIERAKHRRSSKKSAESSSASLSASAAGGDVEKAVDIVNVTAVATQASPRTSTGMTLYIKEGKSLTGRLVATTSLLTWLEGPYHDCSTERVAGADRLVCIAGGVGITGVLIFAATHANAKLYWSMREGDAALAQDLEDVTHCAVDESEVRVGERFDVRALIESEAMSIKWKTEPSVRRELGIIVCGPPGLCDEVRAVVTRMGRVKSSGLVLTLAVEAFAW